MIRVDGRRLAAYQQLLRLPDEPSCPRGSRRTQIGARDRWERWLTWAHVWTARRMPDDAIDWVAIWAEAQQRAAGCYEGFGMSRKRSARLRRVGS